MKLTIAIALGIILSLSGCSPAGSAGPSQTQGALESPTAAQETAESESVLLVDQDDIKVTYTGCEMMQHTADSYSLYITLTVENNSEQDILVTLDDASLNGVVKIVSGVATAYTPTLSGKKSVVDFAITDFDGTGIQSADDMDKAEEIEFLLTVDDSKTYGALFTSDVITITP